MPYFVLFQHMMMATDGNNSLPACVVCGEHVGNDGRSLGSRGLETLREASVQRDDNLGERLIGTINHYAHTSCYKRYTDRTTITRYLKKTNDNVDTRRQHVKERKPFDYPTHCLFCADELDFEKVAKYPNDRNYQISEIVMLDPNKKGIMQESLLKECEGRIDQAALDVKARIIFAGDIRAVEAKYHRRCYQQFKVRPSTFGTTTNMRNLNEINEIAFVELCSSLETEDVNEVQYSIEDMRKKLSKFLPIDVPPYSLKHLKRKFIQHFGSKITITELEGIPNVITFNNTAANILYDTYQEQIEEDEGAHELEREVNKLGKMIGNSIRDHLKPEEFYPSPCEIDIDTLHEQIPDHLKLLMTNILSTSRSYTSKARLKKDLLLTSICHLIMQVVSKKGYVSPLMLSVGVFIHQTTRSRVILDVLSSLGLCVSYSEVMKFERSAAASKSEGDGPVNLSNADSSVNFCQWVADNFDLNEDTVHGKNTTHAMGIISCISPKSNLIGNFKIPLKQITPSDVLKIADRSLLLKPYKKPLKSKLMDLKVTKLSEISFPLARFLYQDTLWLYSTLFVKHPPNWQGFMSHVVNGHFECSTVLFNPMVPLNPETYEAIYSTMSFVKEQARLAGICCGALTFDQPLYLKAKQIKHDANDEFNSLYLRLGGFHQLMSFLGAGCKLFEGGGLDELWETAYAKNSIPKMIQGKAYSKCLRACLITDAALHLVLLKSASNIMDDDEVIDSISDDTSKQAVDIDESVLTIFEQWQEEPDEEEVNDANNLDHGNTEINDILFTGSQNMPEKVKIMSECCKKILSGEQNDAIEDSLNDWHAFIETLKSERSNSRTAQYWFLFMKFVSLIRMFIRAERVGNWDLYISTSQLMLPFFAASGHNKYTKCVRLYLQDSMNLCPCLNEAMSRGLFTVRRNPSLFWSGTWSDMIIEQSLMRSGKTSGGLINITHNEAARAKWLLSAHILAQYSESLRYLTGTCTGTWSEQHREMQLSHRRKDLNDIITFLKFLDSHNPFHVDDDEKLMNIATGVVASREVNADDAIHVGQAILKKMDDRKFGDIKLIKSDQVKTFKSMRKSVPIGNDKLRMTSNELFQRLISTVCSAGPPPDSLFSYELAPVAPSMFYDDGTMRKTQKSLLMQYIINLAPHVEEQPNDIEGIVFDGGALLHHLSWPKVGTMEIILTMYSDYVKSYHPRNVAKVVVFDSYQTSTTKASEQKRRRLHSYHSADVNLSSNIPIPSNKGAFLANESNKQSFINLLGNYLQASGITVIHAGDEGDADVVIVKEALNLAHLCTSVLVIADDTDIFICLLYHISEDISLVMKTKRHHIVIRKVQDVLGKSLTECVLFAHAISGCDTTSSFYAIGKTKAMKLLKQSEKLQNIIGIFGEDYAPLEDIGAAGEQFMLAVYGARVTTLDALRALYFKSPKYVPVERMPPTTRSLFFHSLRVHLQVNTWKNLETKLPLERFGFQMSEGISIPVITDLPAAPEDLLKDIRCACKKIDRLCFNCGCSRQRIPCSIHCKCRGECPNGFVANNAENGHD